MFLLHEHRCTCIHVYIFLCVLTHVRFSIADLRRLCGREPTCTLRLQMFYTPSYGREKKNEKRKKKTCPSLRCVRVCRTRYRFHIHRRGRVSTTRVEYSSCRVCSSRGNLLCARKRADHTFWSTVIKQTLQRSWNPITTGTPI